MIKDPVGGRPVGDDYEQGVNPGGSFIAKALNDKPILKFLGATAVSMVSMKIAGDLIRKGGSKGFSLAVKKAQSAPSPVLRNMFTSMSKDIEDARRVLDEWEGVFRAEDGTKIPMSHYMTPGELKDISDGKDPIAAWSFRDKLQQKLVSQARRLPYELPALYLSQRAPGIGTDSLFGYGDDPDRKVDWYNPLDVLGDFAEQSSKNLTSMLLPIEAGPTVLKGGWKKMLQHAEGAASSRGRDFFVSMDDTLKMLGHSSADIIERGVNVSKKSTAAFSAGIGEAVRHNRGLVEVLDEMKTSARTKGTRAWIKEQLGTLRANPTKSPLIDAAGPVGTARDFGRGFRGVWSDHLGDVVNTGSFDFKEANRRAYQAGKKSFRFGRSGKVFNVDENIAKQPSGNTFIEQIAYSIVSHVGRGSLTPTGKEMRGAGSWYREKLNDLYKNDIIDALAENEGLDRKSIEEVVKLLSVKSRPKADMVDIPISNRIGFGDIIGGDDPAFRAELSSYMERLFPKHGKSIVEDLTKADGALSRADRNFLSNLSSHEKKIEDIWFRGYRNEILPFAKRKAGGLSVLSEGLEDLSDASVQEYLVRTTADEINRLARAQGTALPGQESIATVRVSGKVKAPRTTSDLKSDLENYGFQTHEQMRNFLQSQKVVSKSGTGGFNALGFRRLSAEDALERGYFGDDISPTIRNLLEDMSQGSGGFGRTSLGAVWETRSGSVIDMSHITSGARRLVDSLGENFHIPFIRINPITLLGGEAERSMAQTPIFRFSVGDQPFAGGAGDDPTDAWIFMRDKRSKGTVARVFGGGEGTDRLGGWYRSAPTDSSSMLGRHARLALGDKGRLPREDAPGSAPAEYPLRGKRTFKEWWARWAPNFSVDPDQPNSLMDLGRRSKGGRRWRDILRGQGSQDPRNPARLAELLLGDAAIDGESLREVLRDRSKGGDSFFDDIIEGYLQMERNLRSNRFTPRVSGKILEDIDGLSSRAQGAGGGGYAERMGRIFRPFGVDVSRIESRDDFLSLADSMQREIWSLPDDSDKRQHLQWAFDSLVGKHSEAARGQSRYFEGKSSSQAMRRKGIFRRMDEARSDLVRFGAIREGIQEGGFDRVSQDMLGSIEKLRKSGSITRSEYTEARAAVFSMQLGYDNVKAFNARADHKERVLKAIQDAASITDPNIRGVMEDISRHNLEGGAFGGVRGFLNRRFKGADYSFDGVEYNPFGGSAGQVYVPTFGTVTGSRSRSGAMKSVLGLNTWSDPDSFSGMSIPISHGVQRLNSFFSPFGLGIQETDFKGPLDFYARGMIMKRALPAVALGTAALTLDRTAGGYARERDEHGERVYSPLVLGGVATLAKEAQIAAAVMPGGQAPEEKRRELEEGEVAVRKGRWWPLGNTPWRGGKVEYYRPSWYRRLMSGHTYTSDTYGSPMERMMYGYDFSPLRPFDSYHYEDKHQNTRPYPVSGDYFTGPWGPLTDVLNMSVGKVLKPTRRMHEDEVEMALSGFTPVGDNALFMGTPGGLSMNPHGSERVRTVAGVSEMNRGLMAPRHAIGSGYQGVGASGSLMARRDISLSNQAYSAAANVPAYFGGGSRYGTLNTMPGGQTPPIIEYGEPAVAGSLTNTASGFGYRAQEMLGIYGFGFGAARESLGLGTQDMSPSRPMLQGSTYTFSTSRNFWDLNLGGLGDFPAIGETGLGGLELSEFVRRFVPKERTDVTMINPIRNDMGLMHPWLPGDGYYRNFHEGDPYSKVEMGEARLPGVGYERFNRLHSDPSGRYGVLDRFKILGDVAPYSDEFRDLNNTIDRYATSEEDRLLIQRVRTQRGSVSRRHEFSNYKHSGTDYTTVTDTIIDSVSPGVFMTKESGLVRLAGVDIQGSPPARELSNRLVGRQVSLTYDAAVGQIEGFQGSSPHRRARDVNIEMDGLNVNKALIGEGAVAVPEAGNLRDYRRDSGGFLSRGFENLRHKDNVLNRKLFAEYTAVEKWERQNVYGSTFPEWQSPISNFLMPAIYKSTNRGPILGAMTLGAVGSMFGATARGRIAGSMVGSITGFSAGLIRGAKEVDTGKRFMPEHREKELAVEEYVDILSYVRATKLRNEAAAVGDMRMAAHFDRESRRTMYGFDPSGNLGDAIAAIPDRKRPYFEEMLRAPEKDRSRILSTAGRLERRILQSAWGMPRESRPDLGEYFKGRELPDESWEGWDPSVDMEHIKIKMANSLGLDLSQMGYYPEEVREAHAVNPAYPNLVNAKQSKKDKKQMLQAYMMENGISGYVTSSPSWGGRDRLMLDANVR